MVSTSTTHGTLKGAAIIACAIEILGALARRQDVKLDKDTWARAMRGAAADVALLENTGNDGGEADTEIDLGLMSRAIGHVLCMIFALDEHWIDKEPQKSLFWLRVEDLEACLPCFTLAMHIAGLKERVQLQAEELACIERERGGSGRGDHAGGGLRGKGGEGGLFGFMSGDVYDAGWRARIAAAKEKLRHEQEQLEGASESYHEAFLDRFHDAVETNGIVLDVAAMRRMLALLLDIMIELVSARKALFGVFKSIDKLAAAFIIEPLQSHDASEESGEREAIEATIQEYSEKLADVEAQLASTSLDDDERRALHGMRDRYANTVKEYGHQRILLDERLRTEARRKEGERTVQIITDVLAQVKKRLST